MYLVFSEPFKRDRKKLPLEVQEPLDKALKFLLLDPHYPSLQSRKLPGTDLWYARITKAYRFTFQIDGQTITLRRAGTHDILSAERK